MGEGLFQGGTLQKGSYCIILNVFHVISPDKSVLPDFPFCKVLFILVLSTSLINSSL